MTLNLITTKLTQMKEELVFYNYFNSITIILLIHQGDLLKQQLVSLMKLIKPSELKMNMMKKSSQTLIKNSIPV